MCHPDTICRHGFPCLEIAEIARPMLQQWERRKASCEYGKLGWEEDALLGPLMHQSKCDIGFLGDLPEHDRTSCGSVEEDACTRIRAKEKTKVVTLCTRTAGEPTSPLKFLTMRWLMSTVQCSAKIWPQKRTKLSLAYNIRSSKVPEARLLVRGPCMNPINPIRTSLSERI